MLWQIIEKNCVKRKIDEKNCSVNSVNPDTVLFEESVKLIGSIELFERDFNLIDPEKLIEGGKLNDNLVESLMHALLVKHKVKESYIFSNEICYNVLYKFQHSKVVKRDFKNYNNIIGFLNLNQNHWAVIYADKVSRTFFYIDPFIANESEINMGFKKWVKFMESRPTGDFPKINSWKVGSFKHDKQKDVVNCRFYWSQILDFSCNN